MNEQLVEKVARALCVADEHNPDEIVTVNKSPRDGRLVLITANEARWFAYRYAAKQQIVGFRIIAEHMLD